MNEMFDVMLTGFEPRSYYSSGRAAKLWKRIWLQD